ncbi:hypothetical protein HPB47_024733 [Ixodes persulcatus]|uniref:Uncharacterized protein n=1 Tax=Ixodes persulcatus TaxID=34615 RepID=A0AC60Q5B7_IXOPE|nr:hypothetical protein HPB47_024733 [Ixodes persulcatus]
MLADLECRTAKVVYARLMGKDSNAVVITFGGTRLPKHMVFSRQIFNLKPYRPRPIVCYNCHGLGHMTDVCTCHERRCECCGYIHEEDMEDCKREPQCRNCNGPHVATSKDCPKRKIPGKKSSQLREPLRPQRTSYADAIKVVDSTQSTVQVNSFDPSGSQERASTDWVPDWVKIIANENKPKPQPQLTETKEKDTARVDERYATKAELKRIETKAQWAELKLRFERESSPQVLLLQETRTPHMTLPCYNFNTVPTIRTRPSYREKFPVEKKGWAAVGVLRHIPQAQLDTSNLCSEERKVVAVRLKNGKQRLVVASIYIRTKAKPEEGETKSWIRELLALADKDQLHRDWGYRINTRKGRDIAEAMEEIGLTLRNESGVKTRLAKQARQHDTTPDLTDNLGSDHYPIDVTVEQHKDGRTKEARPIIRWDHFREILLQNLDGKNSIEASIQQAMSKARTTAMVKPGDPTPDMHLLNLSHCESLNSRTGLGKAWRTYRAMEAKKRRTRDAAQNLVLRLNITEDELATQAAQLFFLQANLHDRTMRHNRRGLPNYTSLEDLKNNAGMNQIQDRAEVQSIAHFQRLERTNHGRKLLEIMGYEAEGRLPLEDPAPPWQDTNIVDHRPLPRAHNQGRRAQAATQHAKWCDEHAYEEEIRYTDASNREITTATAWIDLETGRESTTRLSENSFVREVELRAILEATIDILKNTEGPRRAIIFTDSQEALRACRDSKPKSRTAKRIKAIARELRAKGIVLTLEWIPGHAQIPGNEWAHRVAAEAASSNSSATGSTTREDDEETEDPVEKAELARQARKAYLRGLVPTEEDPLPNGYRRWEATRLRRIRTGTALTPAKLAAFGLLKEEDPICKACRENKVAGIKHLLWECKGLEDHRKTAWEKLPAQDQPRRLSDRTHPRGQEQHRKAILDSLVEFIRESGAHKFI